MKMAQEIQAKEKYEALEAKLSELAPEEAIGRIVEFMGEFPNYPKANNDLATLFYQRGDLLQALGRFEKAVRLAPKDRTFRKNLADFREDIPTASIPPSTEKDQQTKLPLYEEGDIPLVSIIILTRNRLDVTKDCIASIRRHTPESYEIIFVDNGSTDGSLSWLKDLIGAAPNYHLIENSEDLGFSAGRNQGMRAARGSYILLLNNDVIVTEEWLSGLLECFCDDGVGVVGPMTDNISGPQKWPCLTYQSLEQLDDFARELRAHNHHIRIPNRRIVGLCMLFRRELMERIGFLNEEFGPGNFEDDDYCLRAALEGFRNLIAADVFIHHAGSTTFKGDNINYREALKRTRLLFTSKWSRPVTNESQAAKIVRLKTLESAESLSQKGFVDEAVSVLLSEGIAKLADEPLFYHALACLFLGAGMPGEALSALAECPVRLSASSRLIQLRALLEQGKMDEAVKEFQDALDSRAEDADSLVLAGWVLLAGQDFRGAEKIFEKARTLAPSKAVIYAGLAEVACSSGDWERCAEFLEQAFRLDPSDIVNAKKYHAVFAEDDCLDRVERILSEARHFLPESETLAHIHIDILLRLGRYQDAMEIIQHALSVFKCGGGFLDAAISVRDRLGPLMIAPEAKRRGISLSLCMIVKDEEKNLPRCIASLLPVVDEIVVADTGSADRTKEIAQVFGARVIEVLWEDNFSAARNAALDEARGDWVLIMDADEVISAQDYEAIRALLGASAGRNIAYKVTSHNYSNRVDLETWRASEADYPVEETARGWFPSEKVRLFPSRSDIRFQNTVHEMVEPSLERLGFSTEQAPFAVHHYGYLDEERKSRKQAQYYELGKRKMAETRESLKAIVELAIQAAEIKKYDEALELWRRALEIDPNSWLAYFNMGYVCLSKSLFREGCDALKRAMELKDNYKEAQVNYLICRLCLGEISEALEDAERYLVLNPDYAMLRLTRAAILAANGEREKAEVEFDAIVDSRIEFAQFIREITDKLLCAGQNESAANLANISGEAAAVVKKALEKPVKGKKK